MTLFASDLYRNFAIGFVGAALVIGAINMDNLGEAIEAPASAAETLGAEQAFEIAPEFDVTQPIDGAGA
ncbi:MAG: hypothetical protein AAF494_11910 [Pseudomonadota bacterium]